MAKKKAASKSMVAPVKTSPLHKGGHYAFFTGVVLVVASAIINYKWSFIPFQVGIVVIGLLGLLVGLLNITRKETQGFLVSSLVIIVSFWLTMPLVTEVGYVGNLLYNVWVNMVVFIAMAAIVVAFKTIYELASDY